MSARHFMLANRISLVSRLEKSETRILRLFVIHGCNQVI